MFEPDGVEVPPPVDPGVLGPPPPPVDVAGLTLPTATMNCLGADGDGSKIETLRPRIPIVPVCRLITRPVLPGLKSCVSGPIAFSGTLLRVTRLVGVPEIPNANLKFNVPGLLIKFDAGIPDCTIGGLVNIG